MNIVFNFLAICVVLPFEATGNYLKTPLPNSLRKPSGLGSDFIDHIKENYVAVSQRDKDGYLPIHVACMSKCSISIISALLEAYPESAFDKDLKNSKYPIQYLVEEKVVDINSVKALLDLCPLSASAKDNSGKIPLHHVTGATALQSRVVIQALLEAFPNGAGIADDSGKLPVSYAVEEDANEEVVALLLNAHPKGAHGLLIKALEGKQWQESLKIIAAYPEAAGVRSKNGKVLPLGVAVSKKAPINVLIAILGADPSSAGADKESSGGFDFMATLELAYQESPVKASELLLAVLPIHQSSGIEYEHHSGFWWTSILSRTGDKYHDIVDLMLVSCALQIQALANCHDEQGRRAVDIATPVCRQLILSRLNFYGRYELQPGCPAHQSATCVVRFAMDHQLKQEVALKFMKYRDHFEKELMCRRMLAATAPPTSTSTVVVPLLGSATSTSSASGLVMRDSAREEGGVAMKMYGKGVSTEEDVGDSRFVLPILRTHNSEEDFEFKYEADIKGFGGYPYCLVMDAADRSLADVITHENVAGKDWRQIRLIMEQIVENLDQMHSRGFIHGDMKPQNVVRDGGRMKLIDLESSVSYADGQCAGVKVSSAYAPPEMVQLAAPVPTSGIIGLGSISEAVVPLGKKAFVKALNRPFSQQRYQSAPDTSDVNSNRDIIEVENTESSYQYPLLPASPSYDMWSVGVMFFELCAGEPLFLADEGENIDEEALVTLHLWTAEFKRKKLSKVSDPHARHLLSQLLQKDPTRRPLTKRVLAHPFLTGKKAQRLVGEKAEYDVFLSYRVFSDAEHAERLYRSLTERGLKVWWDRVSLQPGVPWEEGFCDGLMKCKSFVPLLSRFALKGFEDLNEHSRCDNVLLEFRMAQELRAAGFIDKIFPVMIGDRDVVECDDEVHYIYNDYLKNDCHPRSVPSCSVLSVENKLRAHFDNTALGAPFVSDRSVSGILSDIMANQGGFIKGKLPANLLMNVINAADISASLIDVDKTDTTSDQSSSLPSEMKIDKIEPDAFSSVVESIVRMIGKDKISVKDSLKMDGSEGQNFAVFDILSPGLFRQGVGLDYGASGMPLKERISAVEREIAYLTSILADLNDQLIEDTDVIQ